MKTDYEPTEVMDRESRPNRYYRNAVERHWDPWDVPLDEDRENLLAAAERGDLTEGRFRATKAGLAKFGAGEEAVTEDLAPLAVVLEDIDDQLFLTTHLYEEAKHADFFDHYWTEVINPVERELGWTVSDPKDEKWFNDAYTDLFDRVRKAMHAPLERDTPENRARAYTHYMLVTEGILAQTGYYAFQRNFSGEFEGLPHLPGLVEGFSRIRSDEGRHVGFGMHKLKQQLRAGEISFDLIEETVEELVPYIGGIIEDDRFAPEESAEPVGLPEGELLEYATEKHAERMAQIEDVTDDLPDVDELVALEGDD